MALTGFGANIEKLFFDAYGVILTGADEKNLLHLAKRFGAQKVIDSARYACSIYPDAMLAFSKIGGIALYSVYRSCSACSSCGEWDENGRLTCRIDGWRVSPEIAHDCDMYDPLYKNCAV